MAAEIIEEIEELCQMKHSVMQFFFVQNKKRLLEKFPSKVEKKIFQLFDFRCFKNGNTLYLNAFISHDKPICFVLKTPIKLTE